MNKKQLIALADHIKQAQPTALAFSWEQIQWLACFCKEQNSNFNRERWLGYIAGKSGPSGGSIKPKSKAV